jgi:hypothetical protein
VQGNCGLNSNVSVLKDLEKSTDGRVEYPPLKPFQCTLLIDKPFLLIMNGTLWLDSLYVAVSRTTMQSNFIIVEEGEQVLFNVDERSLFITNSTFVGDGRGSLRAIFSHDYGNRILIEGAALFCLPHIFTSLAVRRSEVTHACRTPNIQRMGSVLHCNNRFVSGMSLTLLR